MKTAKILSLSAGVVYFIFWLQLIFISLGISQVYTKVNLGFNYVVPSLVAHIFGISFAVANFAYFFYLQSWRGRDKPVKNALVYSLILSFGPLVFYILFATILTILSFYQISSGL